MVGWHHQLDGHEFEQAMGVGDEQGSLVCCSPWGCKELDTTNWLNWATVESNRHAFLSGKLYFNNTYNAEWLDGSVMQKCDAYFSLFKFWGRGPCHIACGISSPTRDWSHTPCIGSQSVNHWTTRKVPVKPLSQGSLQWEHFSWCQVHFCSENTNNLHTLHLA